MIRPEDRRPPVPTEVDLPAALLDRLIAFAADLKDDEGNGSTTGYVIRALLDEHLPTLKAAKPERKNTRAKAATK